MSLFFSLFFPFFIVFLIVFSLYLACSIFRLFLSVFYSLHSSSVLCFLSLWLKFLLFPFLSIPVPVLSVYPFIPLFCFIISAFLFSRPQSFSPLTSHSLFPVFSPVSSSHLSFLPHLLSLLRSPSSSLASHPLFLLPPSRFSFTLPHLHVSFSSGVSSSKFTSWPSAASPEMLLKMTSSMKKICALMPGR